MTKFNVELDKPCMVGGTHEHTCFKIMLNGEWVGNGINVVTPEGQRYIRIYNHYGHLESPMSEYFGSRKGVNEVTFSSPCVG